MALTQTRMVGPQTIPTAATTVYTTNANETVIVKQIALTNITTATSETVTLWVVPSGQTRGDQYKFLGEVGVFANETTLINTNIVLTTGDMIDVQASVASTFNLMINGIVES